MTNDARVAVLMGSDSDLKYVEGALATLKGLGIRYVVRIMSAHRTPLDTTEFAAALAQSSIQVVIACAGGAAHLAGVVAAHTTRPVIGVPLPSLRPDGLDALLSTVQMPPGIPVATVGVGAAKNAALLAAEIIALCDPELAAHLQTYRDQQTERVRAKDAAIQERFAGDT